MLAGLAGLSLICWLAAASNDQAEEGRDGQIQDQTKISKRDILGLSPGMANDEIQKTLSTNSWRCAKDFGPMAGAAATTCATELGQLNFRIAENLPKQPLVFLRLFFNSADTDANIAKSITDQYGRSYVAARDDDGNITTYKWHLTQTLLLTFYDGLTFRYLELFDSAINEEDKTAARDLALKRNPTPKF